MGHRGVVVAIALALGGCSSASVADSVLAGTFVTGSTDLSRPTYQAVDEMLEAVPTLTRSGGPVVVMSIADIRDVDHSSPFGNIVADMVRTRLVQRGVTVTEMRLRSSVRFNRADGELMLGRNFRTLMPPPAAAEVITGTYAVANSQIYVSLKIVEAADRRILSAADFVTPRSWNIEQLLQGPVAIAR